MSVFSHTNDDPFVDRWASINESWYQKMELNIAIMLYDCTSSTDFLAIFDHSVIKWAEFVLGTLKIGVNSMTNSTIFLF
jgi:hypothetical protein